MPAFGTFNLNYLTNLCQIDKEQTQKPHVISVAR